MNQSQLINQTSGEVEYYTPQPIIEAARLTLGEIDLDPSSSDIANQRVRALQYFNEETDGLAQVWKGRVWMNHPFGKAESACEPGCCKKSCGKRGFHIDKAKPGNADWINKLIGEFESKRTSAFCCITFACTSEQWYQPLAKFAQCFLSPRTNYILPDGSIKEGVTKGSVVTYGGNDVASFARNFHSLGVVKIQYKL